MIGKILFGFVLLILMVFTTCYGIWIGYDSHDRTLSSWKLEYNGIYSKHIDDYGNSNNFIGNNTIIDHSLNMIDMNNRYVDINNLIQGNSYKIYVKEYLFPFPNRYLIIYEKNN